MKKITILTTTLLCLAAMTVRAQVTQDNAGTPEAIIGQCPDLLGAGILAACYQPKASDEPRQIFLEKMGKLRERFHRITEAAQEKSKENIMPVADKQVRELTGKSLNEVQNMSDAELEDMGNKKANSILKKMGIKKSAKELGSRELSEAEAQQIAGDVAKNMTGMSMKELQAFKNMTEKEQMAYMQQGNRMEQMQKKMGSGTETASISAGNAKSLMAVTEGIKKIQEQWNYIEKVYNKERQEVIEAMRQVRAKYKAQMPKPTGKIMERGVVLLTYLTKEEEKLANRLNLACDTECFTLWLNLVSKRQGQLKIRLADCSRLDELSAKQRELQGIATEIPLSTSFTVAEDYLDITKESASFPWELLSDAETPQTNS